jgi:hypothetical protein
MTQQRDISKNLDGLKPYEEFFWASYLPNRESGRQPYKRHQTLGHAKLAVNYVNGSNADGAKIFHWDGTTWVLAYYVNATRDLVEA